MAVPPAVQGGAGRASIRREVGGDFGEHLVKGERPDPGKDEGSQLVVGFDPGPDFGPSSRRFATL